MGFNTVTKEKRKNARLGMQAITDMGVKHKYTREEARAAANKRWAAVRAKKAEKENNVKEST